ncbi:hypothetical protein ACFM35_00895 [Microbacterium sp. P01]|uniref:hypothetical protein n=1 Tax=Microbacterium sp. P01 TaxID=3366261 RepID=UPI00366AC6BD
MSDGFDAAAQPHCPECGTVMQDIPGGVACNSCKVVLSSARVVVPQPFEGPSIHGG